MLLKGFGFSGYRSFGNELTKIAPLRKVNLIIGQNNVGKSNIINFLNAHYSFFLSKAKGEGHSGQQKINFFTDIDKHISTKPVTYRIAFPLCADEIDSFINEKLPEEKKHNVPRQLLRKILNKCFLHDEDQCIWFVYESNNKDGQFKLKVDLDQITNLLDRREWESLWSQITHRTGGSLERDWIPEVIASLSYTPPVAPQIAVIPAIRKIGVSGSQASDFSGEGIIERLAQIQNPPITKPANYKTWRKRKI